MPDQKCMRCRTYFQGFFCPRCDYRQNYNAKWRRAFLPERAGSRSKPGDSEVRVVQAAYRATDPCE